MFILLFAAMIVEIYCTLKLYACHHHCFVVVVVVSPSFYCRHNLNSLVCPSQVVIESESNAVEYGSLVLEEGAPVKQDMAVDSTGSFLYAMTDTKVNQPLIIVFCRNICYM